LPIKTEAKTENEGENCQKKICKFMMYFDLTQTSEKCEKIYNLFMPFFSLVPHPVSVFSLSGFPFAFGVLNESWIFLHFKKTSFWRHQRKVWDGDDDGVRYKWVLILKSNQNETKTEHKIDNISDTLLKENPAKQWINAQQK
jgi:hypothetical protein